MKKITLKLFCNIVGIGSASGLFFKNNEIYVVSDNGGYLYTFNASDETLKKTPIIEGTVLENIPKKIKPDFEAMSEHDGTLYIFGSGSTQNRNRMVEFVTLSGNVAATNDLSDLYEKMRDISSITSDDFNLEGAVRVKESWLFFQRGNGGTGKNGIFTVNGKLSAEAKITFREIELPKINGVLTSFTDAILVGDDIYFLATAEDTMSTYDDGEVVGSLIGTIDPRTMEIIFSQQITDKHKFEGLTLYTEGNGEVTFLLCEDNDTSYLESEIFQLTIGN